MKPHHRDRAARIAALAALLAVPVEAVAGGTTSSAGVFLTWSPGAETGALGVGLRGSVMAGINGEPGCVNMVDGPYFAGGPTVSARWAFGGGLSLGLAATGSVIPSPESMASPDLGLEVGVVLPLPLEGAVGPEVGVLASVPLLAASVHTRPTLGEPVVLGAGILYPRLSRQLTECQIIVGRPARDAEGLVAPGAVVLGADTPRAALPWADDARQEAASVPAFLQLARELAALGAPDELVSAALDAAEEEVGHAISAARVARLLGAQDVRAEVPTPPGRQLGAEELLARVVAEAWVDGVLGEGTAAHEARVAADRACERTIQSHWRRIAVEEARHAELGWAVLRWSRSSRPRLTAEVLASVAAARRPSPPVEAPSVGRLSAEDREHIADQVRDRLAGELRSFLAA